MVTPRKRCVSRNGMKGEGEKVRMNVTPRKRCVSRNGYKEIKRIIGRGHTSQEVCE